MKGIIKISFKKFLSSKLAIWAVVFAIFYQLVMVIVYIPAYQHLHDHVDNTRVSIVNESPTSNSRKFENSIAHGIHHGNSNTPKVTKYRNFNKAKKALAQSRSVLIIRLPKNIEKDIQQGKRIQIKYYDNNFAAEAGQKIAEKVETSLNDKFSKTYTDGIITKLLLQSKGQAAVKQKVTQVVSQNPQLAANPQAMKQLEDKAKQATFSQMVQQAQSYTRSNPVGSKTQTISKSTGDKTPLTIGLMLIGLGCFISVMSAGVLLISEFETALVAGAGKVKAFAMYEGVYAIMAILAPVLGTIVFKLISGISVGDAFGIYLQNVLLTFVSAQYVSIFIFALGRVSLLINLPIALVQTLVAGAIAPIAMLPVAYRVIGQILPVPFSYLSNMSIVSGLNKSSIMSNDIRLVIMGLIAAALCALVVWLKHFHRDVNKNIT